MARKAYYEENKEKLLAYSRKYYEKNKEKLSARARKHYKENKEKISAYKKNYREKNKGKISAYLKKYYEKNKGKIKKRKKKRCRCCNRLLCTKQSMKHGYCVVCLPPTTWGDELTKHEPKKLTEKQKLEAIRK